MGASLACMSAGQEQFLGVRETARRLGVHENTVRNWVHDGLLTDARVPGSRFLRVRASEVTRLVAERNAAKENAVPNPSMCRIVAAVGGVAISNGGDQAPAIITHVWSEDKTKGAWLVNLTVFPDASNQPRTATSVYLYPDEEKARDSLGQYVSTTAAYWPPIT